MKAFRILILALLISSCISIRVNYDYEKGTDFTQYKTYNYYGDMQTGLSELDTKRFLDALDAKMGAKGFSLSEDPDFLVNIQSSQYQEAPQSSVGVGLGGSGRNVGGGISFGIPVGQSNVNRQIIIDFVDENKTGLFWQAISESSFNPNATPEQREADLKAVVSKLLEGFPPKK